MKNFNKILLASVMFVLLLVGGFTFIGCGGGEVPPVNPDPVIPQPEPQPDPHTHAGEIVYYSISADKTKAYINVDCSCGEIGAVEIDNAIIVNPENAQSIFDGMWNGANYDINNKTIVFDAGEYGTLQLRATRHTVDHVYAYTVQNPNIVGAEITDIDSLIKDKSTWYHYERAFENITFAGTEGAVFKGQIITWSDYMSNSVAQHPNPFTLGLTDAFGDLWHDYVRDPEEPASSSENNEFPNIQHLPMNNITFDRMNFATKNGRITFRNNSSNSGMKNITVKNCKFETENPYLGNSDEDGFYSWPAGAIVFTNANNMADLRVAQKFENIVVVNNVIKGHYMGVYTQNAKNAEISYNYIENDIYSFEDGFEEYPEGKFSYHNLIAIQTVDDCVELGSYVSGKIVIKGNTLTNTKDRALRFGNVGRAANEDKGIEAEGAEIEVVDNIIANADDKGSFAKTSALVNTSFTFKGNTYNGNATRTVENGTESSYIFSTSDEI